MNYNQEQMEENRRALDEAVEHNERERSVARSKANHPSNRR